MKKIIIILAFFISLQTQAQIKIGGKLFDLSTLLNGKLLEVQKGFAPQFSLGNLKIPNLKALNSILSGKKSSQINKLYSTFRTGKTLWHAGQAAGGIAGIYAAVKTIAVNKQEETTAALIAEKDKLKRQVTTGLIATVGTVVTGLIVKLITKKASYKAVDIFNGVVKKKITDIFSVVPYTPNGISNYNGAGFAIRLK